MFEGGMYRAEILKKADENHIYISFIDFGNDTTVNADEIYELPEELKKVVILFFVSLWKLILYKNTILFSNYMLYIYVVIYILFRFPVCA